MFDSIFIRQDFGLAGLCRQAHKFSFWQDRVVAKVVLAHVTGTDDGTRTFFVARHCHAPESDNNLLRVGFGYLRMNRQ